MNGIGVNFSVEDDEVIKAFDQLLSGAGSIAKEAARHAAEELKARVAEKMPVDAGVARDSLRIVPTKLKRRGYYGFDVEYDTEMILAHSPPTEQDPRGHWFYPATIEYGSPKLHRESVAPMREAVDLYGEAIVTDMKAELGAAILAEAAKYEVSA